MIARSLSIALIAACSFVGIARAAELGTPKQEIIELNDSIQVKKSELEELRDRIQTYAEIIEKKQKQEITLENGIGLLENRIAKTTLDFSATQLEIEQVSLEIDLLASEIAEKDERIIRERELLAELLREIKRYDDRTDIELLLGVERFSDFFSQLHYLEDTQGKLEEAFTVLQTLKRDQENERGQREERRLTLERLRSNLRRTQTLLEDEQGAKEVLLASVQSSEREFQTLLRELKAESQFVDAEIGSLEGTLAERLRSLDEDFGSGAIFTWPIIADQISAGFHDPSYPFRHLFEHSGVDLPTAQGTSVKAAAPGVVAVARTGRLYGNYVVIIHANGFSTLYAHLSRISVSAEQIVERDEVIGRSGGARGAAGAGLSTGPHLHFEIREQGIPVDPLNHLVAL